MESTLAAFLLLADAVIVTDAEHRIIEVNAAYEEVTGHRRESIIGLKAGVTKSGLTPKKTYDEMKLRLSEGKPWLGIFINRKRNKELWHSHITITPFQVKGQTYYVGVFRDLSQLSEGLYVSESRKMKIRNEMLKVLALSCEIRDPDIEGHLTRVQFLTANFLKKYKDYTNADLSEEYINQVVNASIMHDIGKSGIPEGILYKPGQLTVYERAIIETHPLIGVDILNKISGELEDELFRQESAIAKAIVESHHEKWDGTGYPHRLKGDDIPFEAQVVSIIDVYDALASRRPYKDAWKQDEILTYLRNESGKSFNPELVEVFCSMMETG